MESVPGLGDFNYEERIKFSFSENQSYGYLDSMEPGTAIVLIRKVEKDFRDLYEKSGKDYDFAVELMYRLRRPLAMVDWAKKGRDGKLQVYAIWRVMLARALKEVVDGKNRRK